MGHMTAHRTHRPCEQGWKPSEGTNRGATHTHTLTNGEGSPPFQEQRPGLQRWKEAEKACKKQMESPSPEGQPQRVRHTGPGTPAERRHKEGHEVGTNIHARGQTTSRGLGSTTQGKRPKATPASSTFNFRKSKIKEKPRSSQRGTAAGLLLTKLAGASALVRLPSTGARK